MKSIKLFLSLFVSLTCLIYTTAQASDLEEFFGRDGIKFNDFEWFEGLKKETEVYVGKLKNEKEFKIDRETFKLACGSVAGSFGESVIYKHEPLKDFIFTNNPNLEKFDFDLFCKLVKKTCHKIYVEPVNLDVLKYEGNKLLLGAGHQFQSNSMFDDPDLSDEPDQPEDPNYNNGFYTVDQCPFYFPDYIGNLRDQKTYDYLSQKQFELIVDESGYLLEDVKNCSPILKSGGILFSYLNCNKDDSLIEMGKKIRDMGFSKVIFTHLNTQDWANVNDMKKFTIKESIDWVQKNEIKEPQKQFSACNGKPAVYYAPFLVIK